MPHLFNTVIDRLKGVNNSRRKRMSFGMPFSSFTENIKRTIFYKASLKYDL